MPATFDPSSLLRQVVTYWEASPDGFGGSTYATPQRMKGRWEDVNETFVDASGREVVSQAKVWVERDVILGSYLALGALPDATPPSLAKQIRGYFKTPSVEADVFERMAML